MQEAGRVLVDERGPDVVPRPAEEDEEAVLPALRARFRDDGDGEVRVRADGGREAGGGGASVGGGGEEAAPGGGVGRRGEERGEGGAGDVVLGEEEAAGEDRVDCLDDVGPDRGHPGGGVGAVIEGEIEAGRARRAMEGDGTEVEVVVVRGATDCSEGGGATHFVAEMIVENQKHRCGVMVGTGLDGIKQSKDVGLGPEKYLKGLPHHILQMQETARIVGLNDDMWVAVGNDQPCWFKESTALHWYYCKNKLNKFVETINGEK